MGERLGDLMAERGVAFGTSGARGLVTALDDRVVYAVTRAFLELLDARGELGARALAVAGDLRPSTPRIVEAVGRAALDVGCELLPCGLIPTPALACWAFSRRTPSIMVTGSHIPDDRNGLKLNTPTGELTKADEVAMLERVVDVPAASELAAGSHSSPRSTLPAAEEAYEQRYVRALGEGALEGLRVAVYGHSAVGRDSLAWLLEELGATVVRVGWSERFVPVDTEAVRAEDAALALDVARAERVAAIVSTDGDGDRPLVFDETGALVRGDVLGLLTAGLVGASSLAVPITCTTAIERSGRFSAVRRTRIGSPFVIEAMLALAREAEPAVGFEANGGFLTASPVRLGAGTLSPLPTRDAMLPMLAVLEACARGAPLSTQVARLPERHTWSDRVPDVPSSESRAFLRELADGGAPALEALLGSSLGPVRELSTLDGVRATFESGDVVHFRASGNAPEIRYYVEAAARAGREALSALAEGALRARFGGAGDRAKVGGKP